jgi:hypothetical protein
MSTPDTTHEAARVQNEVHRRLGPESRFRLAIEMSDAVMRLSKEGMQRRRPDLSEAAFDAAP